MGAASEGGYLGSDSASFFSAVVSGAAGSYIVTLTADAGIGTDLVIEPGQGVHISGDSGLAVSPSWGRGGFTVTGGTLTLSRLTFSKGVSVATGTVVVNRCQFYGSQRFHPTVYLRGILGPRPPRTDRLLADRSR